MAEYTGSLPVFMGLDAWTVKQAGLHFAHVDPTDTWAIYIASNGPVNAAAVISGESYRILFVSTTPNCSGYDWTGFGKHSYNMNSISGDLYYAISNDIPTVFSGLPFVGVFTSIEDALEAYTPTPTPSEDPFSPGGTSGPGGGGMSGDLPPHEPIDFPSDPSISATNAGFVSIWTPTEKQVRDLAAYLWTTDILTGAFWKKIIQNPLDLIFGLQIMPVPIYHTEGELEPKREDEYEAMNDNVVLGWTNTRIKMDYIPMQFVEVDCGEIDMDEYWKAYLDYAPYTKIDIYLPYIGVKSLNTNDCMDRTIHLKYKIDLASGSCVAIVKCGDSVYYHFSGNCASAVPLTAVQMQEVIRNAMTTAVAVGAGAIAAGAGASPIAVEASKAAVAASAARTVMSGPEYHRSGSNASTTGLMSVQTPYLIITRPRQAIPENQNTYTGYPSFITEQIGDLEGYTEIEIIHMHNMSCTEEEFNEIEELLLKGVII